MKRLSNLLALTLLGLAASGFASADDPSSSGSDFWGHGGGFRHLERCLSRLDLSSDQRSAIVAIVAAGRDDLRADVEALEEANDKLRDDLASDADKCVLGQDLLDREAQADNLRAAIAGIRDQILAKLTPEQQARFNACTAGRRTRTIRERSNSAE